MARDDSTSLAGAVPATRQSGNVGRRMNPREAGIRIWMRGEIPVRFQDIVPSEIETGVITIYLAHVPAAVLANPTYQACNGEEQVGGWIREGELGLFGTNGLDVHDHPDGDGILILGVCV